MSKKKVDINCDIGESFGVYQLGNDEELMKYITSANVACGFHAGDYNVIDKTVRLAFKNGVNVGAHPGYPDLQGMGRRPFTHLNKEELRNVLTYQLGALDGFLRLANSKIGYVKVHGAWSNAMHNEAQNGNYSQVELIAETLSQFDNSIPLMLFAASKAASKVKEMGIPVIEEIFADRAYNSDSTLVPRGVQGSVITSKEHVVKRVINMVKNKSIPIIDGGEIENVNIDTICVHGDTPGSANLVKAIRKGLMNEGIEICPF